MFKKVLQIKRIEELKSRFIKEIPLIRTEEDQQRFKKEVEEPLDKAWLELTEEERECLLSSR